MDKELDFLESGNNEETASLDDILNMDISGLAPETASKNEESSVEEMFGSENFSLDSALANENIGDIFGSEDVFGTVADDIQGDDMFPAADDAFFADESGAVEKTEAETAELVFDAEAEQEVETADAALEATTDLEAAAEILPEEATTESSWSRETDDAGINDIADACTDSEAVEMNTPEPGNAEAIGQTEEDFLSVSEDVGSPFTTTEEAQKVTEEDVEAEVMPNEETEAETVAEAVTDAEVSAVEETAAETFLQPEKDFEAEGITEPIVQPEEEAPFVKEESNLDEFRTLDEAESVPEGEAQEVFYDYEEKAANVSEENQDVSGGAAAGGVVNFAEMDNYNDEKQGFEDAESACFLKWYSGTGEDEYFKVSKESESAVLKGNRERKAIHVNVGYDTYGWQVQFDNGINMNLRDVREYQLRNGKLPNSGGIIVYGNRRSEFSNIERIVVYEEVQYFSYA